MSGSVATVAGHVVLPGAGTVPSAWIDLTPVTQRVRGASPDSPAGLVGPGSPAGSAGLAEEQAGSDGARPGPVGPVGPVPGGPGAAAEAGVPHRLVVNGFEVAPLAGGVLRVQVPAGRAVVVHPAAHATPRGTVEVPLPPGAIVPVFFRGVVGEGEEALTVGSALTARPRESSIGKALLIEVGVLAGMALASVGAWTILEKLAELF